MLRMIPISIGLRSLPGTIGMIILAICAIRRANAIGEGWLTKSIIIISAIGTIPFFALMIIINPFNQIVSYVIIVLIAFGSSAIGVFVVLSMRLRGETPWAPRHPKIAIAIILLALLPLIGRMLIGIFFALSPLGIMLGKPIIGGGSFDVTSIMLSNGGWTGSLIMAVITVGLYWTMFTDDKVSKASSLWSKPLFALPIIVVMLIAGWQTTSPTSILQKLTNPEKYEMIQKQRRNLAEVLERNAERERQYKEEQEEWRRKYKRN